MRIVLLICAIALCISAVLVLIRLEKGPRTLDRAGAVDVLTSILVSAVALLAAASRREDLLAVLIVVAVVGFIGSVSIARFPQAVDTMDPKGRALEEREYLRRHEDDSDDELPAHDPERGVVGGVREPGAAESGTAAGTGEPAAPGSGSHASEPGSGSHAAESDSGSHAEHTRQEGDA